MSTLILVVDHEPDLADFFERQFRRELWTGRLPMDSAQSTAEALERTEDAAGELSTKPIDLSVLRERIDQRLAQRGLPS